MLTKTFNEMMAVNVDQYCDSRKGKDDNGKQVDLKYLNWAVCKKLLHENGAEKVFFTPLVNEKGSSLFFTDRVYGSEDKTNQCYEVGVHIVIDDLEFDMRGPLMNGSNPVRDNSISQQRIWNCQTRLFVKGVAMMTGLGFGLWIDEEKNEPQKDVDDLEFHRISKVKERIEQLVTEKMKEGFSLKEIAKATGVGEDDDDVRAIMKMCVKINNFEVKLRGMKPAEESK